MIFAIAGAAWLSVAGALPNEHIVQVQERGSVKLQPFSQQALRLAMKECRARIAKDNPTIKVQGNFSLAVRYRNQTLVKMLNIPPDDLIAVTAPVIFTAAIGGPRKGTMGCKFNIKDEHLVYDRMDIMRM